MSSPPKRWRAPVVGAAAGLLAAAAFVGQSALASGGGAAPPRPAAKAAIASGTAAPAGTDCGAPAQGAGAKAAPGPDPGPAPFLAAVAQLVQAGTINQSQADTLDAGIRAGSLDDSQLVANGTLSAAQMQAVEARLKAVKESLAPHYCGAPAEDAGAKAAPGQGPGPAPFLAAVAQLVQAGTINQSQADTLDAGIRAGSIDDSQLVANGTLSAAQMQAVDARLKAIKESLAPAGDRSQGANADHSKVARATADRKKLQR